MFKNRDIVCISTINWDFLYQRHQILMELFAKSGSRVFYLENINPSPVINLSLLPKLLKQGRKIFFKPAKAGLSNIRIISPFILPLKNKVAGCINQKVFIKYLSSYLTGKGVKNPMIWTYLATSLAIDLIARLKPSLLIYDCVFDAPLHPSSPKDIFQSEVKLIRLADAIFTDNSLLLEKCAKINRQSYLIPPGVIFEDFDQASFLTKTNSFLHIPGPRICFFGGIDNLRLDLELIRGIALAKPLWSIILLGPVIKTDVSLLKLKNVYFRSAVDHSLLGSYLASVDVLILPYKIIPFSNSIFPAKIFECLATGKPIVSTPLPQLSLLSRGLIKIAENPKEFIDSITSCLNYDSDTDKEKRRIAARENSWLKRINEIRRVLNELPDRKAR
ncbi:MAG: glycosyltransferase [Candidatus Omnitrophota bacterium]